MKITSGCHGSFHLRRKIIFLILSSVVMSCSRCNDGDIVEIDSSRINKHVFDATKQYITEHPEFSSYIIDTNIEKNGYISGILFTISHNDSNLFNHGEGSIPLYPSICFKVKGKNSICYLKFGLSLERNFTMSRIPQARYYYGLETLL